MPYSWDAVTLLRLSEASPLPCWHVTSCYLEGVVCVPVFPQAMPGQSDRRRVSAGGISPMKRTGKLPMKRIGTLR